MLEKAMSKQLDKLEKADAPELDVLYQAFKMFIKAYVAYITKKPETKIIYKTKESKPEIQERFWIPPTFGITG